MQISASPSTGGGSFTLSCSDSDPDPDPPCDITLEPSSFIFSLSSESEILVVPSGGYSGDVQLSVVDVSPPLPFPQGFSGVYTDSDVSSPDDVVEPSEYDGSTFFKARPRSSNADSNMDKTFIITLRGTDTVNPAITDDIDITLIIRKSDPGGGPQ